MTEWSESSSSSTVDNPLRNTFMLSVIGVLSELTNLNLSGIGLTEIPKAIESFLGLRHVNISNNQIEEIDGSIYNQFRYVSTLDISKNKLTEVSKVSLHGYYYRGRSALIRPVGHLLIFHVFFYGFNRG